ncbi:MAG: monovalent cation/H+ antiporter subunit D family protein [Gemmatimonadota bacterium]
MTAERLVLLTLALPTVGALLIALTGRSPNLREGITLLTSGALLVTVLSLLPAVLGGARPEVTLVEMFPDIAVRLAVEPLGMIFACVGAILWPINSLYSIGYMRGNQEKNQTRFYVCFGVALAAVMGIAFSGNLLTLFVFYEVLTVSTYPLVTHKGSEDAVRAGRVYLGILLTTSIGFLLPAIIWTWAISGTVDFAAGGILAGSVSGPLVGVLLALFMFGIGKAALMPMHRWLPAAMVAPTPVSALLHAVAVVKAGVFSVVKVLVYIFGLDFLRAESSTHWLIYASGFTVIVASIVAFRILRARGNLKRMLAYSTIAQLSYVILAAAIMTQISTAGAALHIVAHAFGKITLFFAAGSIYTAAHKTEISQLDGIGRRMPFTMGAFAIGALSMVGLPPTGGFISKWYMLGGAFESGDLLALSILVVSTLLNAAYFGPIVHAAFFRKEASDHDGHGHGHGEAPWPIVVALTATASLTVLLFFFPDVATTLARQIVGLTP